MQRNSKSQLLLLLELHLYLLGVLLGRSIVRVPSPEFGLIIFPLLQLGPSFCLLCFCNGIVTAAGLCTGPIPVHFCGPQPDGGYMYALIS